MSIVAPNGSWIFHLIFWCSAYDVCKLKLKYTHLFLNLKILMFKFEGHLISWFYICQILGAIVFQRQDFSLNVFAKMKQRRSNTVLRNLANFLQVWFLNSGRCFLVLHTFLCTSILLSKVVELLQVLFLISKTLQFIA